MYIRCNCDESARQRKLNLNRRLPYTLVNGPNEDGEITCAYCWEVIGIV